MLYKKNILEIKSKGYSIINNFLNEQEINYFKKFVGSIHLEKRLRKEKIFYSKNNFDFKNFRYFFLNKKLFKLIKKNNLQKISSEILNKNTELRYIDGYFSEISSNFILDWHVDRAYSGNLNPKKLLNPNDYAIKCIIYLDDVFSNNGCLGIIQNSNQITYYLRKGIFENEIKYSPYWKLKDLNNLIKKKEIKSYLNRYLSEEVIEKFIINSNFIQNFSDTNKYDIKLNKGDLLIFDETVVHRAAESKSTSRSIIRLFFK